MALSTFSIFKIGNSIFLSFRESIISNETRAARLSLIVLSLVVDIFFNSSITFNGTIQFTSSKLNKSIFCFTQETIKFVSSNILIIL